MELLQNTKREEKYENNEKKLIHRIIEEPPTRKFSTMFKGSQLIPKYSIEIIIFIF